MLRFLSRKEAEAAGVLRDRSKASDATPHQGRIDGVDTLGKSRLRPEAKPGASDSVTRGDARRPKKNRRRVKRGSEDLGDPVGKSAGAFELDFAPAPILGVEPSLAMGESAGPSARRVLLDGIALPMPPSINAYWSERVVWSKEKSRHFPIRYVTHEGKAYQQYIRELMLEGRWWYRSPHPVALSILCCFAHERDQDIDNRVKVLQDALTNGFVVVDDKQVKRLEVREGPRMKPATVFVRLEEIIPDRNANLAWIRGKP